MDHMQKMIETNAPFAKTFHRDNPVFDKVDSELLFWGLEMIVPGGCGALESVRMGWPMLCMDHMQKMIESNAPFARKFHRDDPVLDKIDSELLFRGSEMIVPGGWCIGSRENGSGPCSLVGSITTLRPTSGAERLGNLISSLLSSESFRPKQCK
ncbi:hypothetical protein Tco_0355537 [Tanacetum coccineum]